MLGMFSDQKRGHITMIMAAIRPDIERRYSSEGFLGQKRRWRKLRSSAVILPAEDMHASAPPLQRRKKRYILLLRF